MTDKFSVAALLLAMALAAPTAAEPLDFRRCVAEALTNNPDLATSAARIGQAEAGVLQSEGAHLPRVNLSLTATRSNDPLNAFGLKLGQGHVAPADMAPAALNDPAAVNNFNTRIEVLAPLYTGGQLSARTEQARAAARAVRQDDKALRQQLIRQVAEAYQGVHTARAHLRVAEESAKAADEYLRVTDSLLKQGMAVKSDVLSARVNLEDARLRVIEARRQEAGALDRLKMLMGRPLTDNIEIGAGNGASLPDGEEAALLEQARSQHPGLKARREQLEAARAQVDVARASRRPRVDLMARQDWNDDSLGLAAGAYTVAGVVSWNAFDGGVASAGIDQARAALAEAEARLRQAENSILFEVREARRQSIEAEVRVTAREAAVADAKEAQRLTRKRYENGLATLVDLLAVQAQLDQARAGLVAARHDREVSRIELRRATGMLGADTL
ncbi:MAG: TolC family protein [Gallionellaceae bacterium]|nr:TolC family protein [Gallionellaceae bacterium]